MAFDFDNASDYLRIENDSALGLSGDFTIAGWVKMHSTAMDGATTRKVLTRNYNAGPSTNGPFVDLYIHSSSSTDPYDITTQVFFVGGSGDFLVTSTSNPFQSNTNWTHIAWRRSGSTIQVLVNGSSVVSFSGTTNDIGGNQPLYLGSRDSHNRNFDGAMAEWAKWDRALSDTEIATLAKFFAPSWFPGSSWYLPMIREYVEVQAGLTVTNSGITVVDHPPVIYPYRPYIIQAPVSAGETFEFAGSQTVSFDGMAGLVQTATFSDSQTVSFDGIVALQQIATFTDSASVSFDGQAALKQTANLAGAETVSFDGTADTVRNHWSFDGSGAVSFDGNAALQRTASFEGAETVSFDGEAALKQSVALTGAETVSFDGEAALEIAAFIFEGQGVLSFDGSIATLNAILQMEAAQSVTFDGQAQLGQEALFAGGATLSFNGFADLEAFQWGAVDTPTSTSWQDVD